MSDRPDRDGVMECSDGHRCENWSLCVEDPTDEGNYYCDCDASELKKAFEGLYCEHEATEYCSYKGAVSRNSFCTNGGECIAQVGLNDAHLGCDCPKNYEGAHCQFVRGTKPQSWPTGVASNTKPFTGSNHDNGIGLGGIVAIVIGVIAIGLMGAVFGRRQLRSRQEQIGDEIPGISPNNSGTLTSPKTHITDIDADGASLREAVSNMGTDSDTENAMMAEEGEII